MLPLSAPEKASSKGSRRGEFFKRFLKGFLKKWSGACWGVGANCMCRFVFCISGARVPGGSGPGVSVNVHGFRISGQSMWEIGGVRLGPCKIRITASKHAAATFGASSRSRLYKSSRGSM